MGFVLSTRRSLTKLSNCTCSTLCERRRTSIARGGLLRGGVPDRTRRTACVGSLVLQTIEFEQLADIQCRLCSAYTMVFDTGFFQDHGDQGKQHGWHGVLLTFWRKSVEHLVISDDVRPTIWGTRARWIASVSVSSSQTFAKASPRSSLNASRTSLP